MLWFGRISSLFLLVILLIVQRSESLGCTSTRTIEYEALQDLYNATNGIYWSWRGIEPEWFSSSRNPCYPAWQGLTCGTLNSICFVQEIKLLSYNLSGTLPRSIGNFMNLTFLSLASNDVYGTIPATIGLLQNLENLVFTNNSLSGSVPFTLFDLGSLTTLSLDFNTLSGTISPRVGNLTLLKTILLNVNNFGGTLPYELFTLPAILLIDIHGNNFTGTLPAAVKYAQSLLELDLANNALTGRIPPEIGQMSSLRDFHAQSNSFTGSIPEELYNCTTLVELFLHHMDLSGTISPSIKKLSNLGYLYLQYTNISGSLPTFPDSIRFLNLDNMNLNGSIPQDFFELPSLAHVLISSNRITGTIPSNIGSCSTLIVFTANNNALSGSIPNNINNAKRLEELYLQYNQLNGSIPVFSQFIYSVQLDNNYLTGSLPNELYSAVLLRNFDISNNLLSGSISDAIGNLTHLNTFVFNYNFFTGSFPTTIGKLSNLLSLEGSTNLLVGSIPKSICNCTLLNTLYAQSNILSGSIPECIFSTLSVSVFEANDNQLSGTLPKEITNSFLSDLYLDHNELSGSLPSTVDYNLRYMKLEFNDFHGNIPDTLFVGRYQTLEIDANYLTGTLPSSVDDARSVSYLNIFGNYLSGTLPYVGNLQSLQMFYIDENFFSGSVSCFNSTTQLLLSAIDLSVNEFSGSLPEELFRLPSLSSLAVVQNCITGSISSLICNAKNLEVLALDGLYTAVVCRYDLFNGNYALNYQTPGTIPSCLFSMPKIQTLHVSGNGIGGSLPYDLNVSRTLSDVALSYNQLTGSIPFALQFKSYYYFDLSFNTFGGLLLPQEEPLPSNASVYMQVNRLSGRIPVALLDVEIISVLNSNLFECQHDRKQLPKHDNQFIFYECGTTSLQHSIYAFVAMLGVMIVVICSLYLARVEIWTGSVRCGSSVRALLLNYIKYINISSNVGDKYRGINDLNTFIDALVSCITLLAAVIFFVMMPAYVALSEKYSIYQNNYAWVVSSMYLSGFEPAMTLMILYLAFSVLLFTVLFKSARSLKQENVEGKRRSTVTEVLRQSYKQYLGLAGIALFNFVIVLAVNVGYILLSTRVNPEQLSWLELLLAIFKFVWNDVVVRNMTKNLHRMSTVGVVLPLTEEQTWNSRYLSFNAYVLLFNTIVIPCLATAFVSSECFYNVYVRPLNVVSTISYQSCTGYETVVAGILTSNCTSYYDQTLTTSYLPPYIYRYQCASTLVTTYAVVYVYKFILSAFVRPLVVLIMISLDDSVAPESRFRNYFVSLSTNTITNTEGRAERLPVFQSDQFNLRIIMFFSVLVTFGVMFPPLAVMICISVVMQCYCTRLILGRYIAKQPSVKQETAISLLSYDTEKSGVMFFQTVYLIGGPAAFFYAYFLFDTYGDAVGARNALWMAITMFVFTLICTAAFRVGIESFRVSTMERSVSTVVEMVDQNQLKSDDKDVVYNPALC